MLLLRIWWHASCWVKVWFYRLLYGKALKTGRGVYFRNRFSLVIDGGKVTIGDHCFFNNNCLISCQNRIEIGADTLVGPGVVFFDSNHRFRDKNKAIAKQGFSVGSVVVGKNCWIGSNAVMLKGCDIGDHSVVSAGCVVSGAVPANSIVRRDGTIEPMAMEKEQRKKAGKPAAKEIKDAMDIRLKGDAL